MKREEVKVMEYLEYLSRYSIFQTTFDKVSKNCEITKRQAEQVVKNLTRRGYIEKCENWIENQNGNRQVVGNTYKVLKCK